MKTYPDDLSRSIHETAKGLLKVGLIDEAQLGQFDASCLLPTMDPGEIRALRERESLTREDLARELVVSPDLVGRWERGKSRPSPQASKLLDLVRRKGIDAIR